jgi:hypothetical protein
VEAKVGWLLGGIASDRGPDDTDRLFAGFTGWAPPFREPAARAVRAAQPRAEEADDA